MSVAEPFELIADRHDSQDGVRIAEITREEAGDRRVCVDVADQPQERQPDRAIGRRLDKHRPMAHVASEKVHL